ncbi:hypothetical protein [Tautonia plasticadhaerens]|uniref:Uncharacterized protein n=1 Tax=Tautonia plasticadhaerens TaxID=2527974 RepID=A0A518GWQ3_9BACT|nr:hypothetical protein [Tautonia plasticadhaerens]QDV33026.1 hypothetical protein ElP_08680 [Tautonia plasticadhaerens]
MSWTEVGIAVATLAFGVAIGMLVGLSRSPVVGVVLPILFSIIGGTGGFYFSRVNLGTIAGRRAARLASVAVFLLSVGTLVGVWSGIEVRARPRPWSLVSDGPDALFPTGDLASGEAIEWVLLDAKLKLMGLGTSERREIIARIRPGVEPVGPDEFRGRVASLLKRFEAIIPAEGVVNLRTEWTDVADQLRSIRQILLSSAGDVRPEVFKPILDATRSQLRFLRDDDDDKAYIAANPEVEASLEAFQVGVLDLYRAVEGSVSAAKLANERLDAFLAGDSSGEPGSLQFARELAGGPEGPFPGG